MGLDLGSVFRLIAWETFGWLQICNKSITQEIAVWEAEKEGENIETSWPFSRFNTHCHMQAGIRFKKGFLFRLTFKYQVLLIYIYTKFYICPILLLIMYDPDTIGDAVLKSYIKYLGRFMTNFVHHHWHLFGEITKTHLLLQRWI